jgi:transcriptional regulator with XRE-family HTH domain
MNESTAESPIKVFGGMLAHYRTKAGMTPEQLAARVYLSASLIRKVEAGTRTPTEELAKACDDALNCDGALIELFDRLSPAFRERSYPVWFGRWPDIEAAARSLRTFEPLVIPGLLQTEAYARAILSTRVGDTEDEVEELVSGRMKRQAILHRDKPPTLWAILDEAALRRCVGGREVMREQLAHLQEMARRPSIVIQVIPLSTGAHQGLNGGAFVVADLPGKPLIAYQDTASSGQIIEDADDIEALGLLWDSLNAEALPRTASLALLREVESTWNDG